MITETSRDYIRTSESNRCPRSSSLLLRILRSGRAFSAYACDECRDNAGEHVADGRVSDDGHEVRPEDRRESARAGDARRDGEDARVPSDCGHAGVRVAR